VFTRGIRQHIASFSASRKNMKGRQRGNCPKGGERGERQKPTLMAIAKNANMKGRNYFNRGGGGEMQKP